MAQVSSTPQSTRDAILEYALKEINEYGAESLRMREIARDLRISPGNLTYHFPTKEALLAAIARQVSDLNDRTEALGGLPQGLDGLLERFRAVFLNHVAFRGLLLALVHLTDRYPRIRSDYEASRQRRSLSFAVMLRHLRDHGSIKSVTSDAELERLAGYCTLIGRFWIAEAHVDGRDVADPATHAHYLDLLAAVFAPYASERGRAEIAPYLHPR